MSSLKSMIASALKPEYLGQLEFYLQPSKRAAWGGPMNGQSGRVALCREISAAMKPSAIVETGTFRGTTTSFLASLGVPVYSVEAQQRFLAFARLNTRHVKDRVNLTLSDSRSFLRKLIADPSFSTNRVFFYLDAHWNADLPLAEEINIIFDNCSESVIMIDDFEVPGDSYAYDDYGPGSALNSDYLDSTGRSDMYRFYPSLPAYKETGAKRGCVVLCNDIKTRELLSNMKSLRPE